MSRWSSISVFLAYAFRSIVFYTSSHAIIPDSELKQKRGQKGRGKGQESSYLTDIGIRLSGLGRYVEFMGYL